MENAEHIRLADNLARRFCDRLGIHDPDDVDDYIQSARVAMLEAEDTFDLLRGANLKSWLFANIEWALANYHAQATNAPSRRIRDDLARVAAAEQYLTNKMLLRAPSQAEVAEAAGMSGAQYQELRWRSSMGVERFYDDEDEDDADGMLPALLGAVSESEVPDDIDGYEQVENEELLDVVREIMDTMRERERDVISMLFLDGHTLRETSALLGIPIGTLHGIRDRALAQIRRRLGLE